MIKNAILSLRKNIGKSILLFVIMAVIANLIIAGLSIQSGSAKSMEQIKSTLGNDVTLTYNVTNMMQNRQPMEEGEQTSIEMPEITEDMALTLVSLEHVESYNFQRTFGVESTTITPVEIEQSSRMPMGGGGGTMTSSSFTLSGNSTMEYDTNFTEGNYTLLEGRTLTTDDKNTNNVVIETNLATANGLSVGSVFNVTGESQEYEVNVVGIYEVTTSSSMESFTRDNPVNTIYADIEFVQSMTSTNTLIDAATYYLDSPENMDAFIEAATNLQTIDMETFSLSANDRLYEMNVSSLENAESFANMFLVVVIVAGSAILCLILILTIRGRFYEIGVFLSLGQSKIKIIGQQLIEVFVIAMLAMVLSLGTGTIVSGMVSDMLLSSSTTQESGRMGGGMPEMQEMQGMTQGTATSDLDVSLTLETVLQLVGISGAICLISVSIPSAYILRRTPREILSKKEG